MKKIVLIISLVALFSSCEDTSKKKQKEVVELPTLALADFDANAGEFLDKEIQVKGIVDHVCKHGGKKLLLVNDEGDVHVESEARFDDAMVGDEVAINGIVTEFRVDEAYLLKKEEDNLQSHKDGTDSKDVYDQKMEKLQYFRDSMKVAKVDHLSYYSLDYVSHKVLTKGEPKKKEEESKTAE